ncbi:hypothetical protein [Haladaptatus caseinilyticus]|uniref:hypothetical protein n=1 Tax=Haladaptatus caseinilyticus TaxID=2993314 RepID=UPI00224ADA2E|nr:hypothetical protein [Haladaptatus caseinilyticus]
MSPQRCPVCGQTVTVTAIRGPSAITVSSCGHEISHRAALIDAPSLDPLSPGKWVTEFLTATDDD